MCTNMYALYVIEYEFVMFRFEYIHRMLKHKTVKHSSKVRTLRLHT